jgi:hypothetical protein
VQVERCTKCLETAGWDGLILERCLKCRGLFLELGEWKFLAENPAPVDEVAFVVQFKDAMIHAGTAALTAAAIAQVILRFVR